MMRGARIASALALLLLANGAGAAPRDRWIASWGSAQMVPENENALPADFAANFTLRQTVRLSAGGSRLRVRLSNVHGTAPLAIGAATVARATPGSARLAGPATPLRFGGRADVVIPAGAEIHSDPVAMVVAPGGDLALSLYLPAAPARTTGHPGARATGFLARGNQTASADLASATPTTRWCLLSDVEVAGASGATTVVAIGDSITDGYGVKPDTNTRWTDILAARLRGSASTAAIGLVNAGIGGNRVLLDGLGPSMVARFDRDVIGRSGVAHAVVTEGINDLGVLGRDRMPAPAEYDRLVADMTAGFRGVVARAHARGIRVMGGTLTPFVGNDYYHPGPVAEAARQAVNRFIRESGTFDAVVDFDRALRDPAHPDRLLAAYDSGDHLHPSEAGYRAMGELVPLSLFGGSEPAGIPLAITVDDMPSHGPLPRGTTRLEIARRIVDALVAERAPAFGFLNAGVGADDPDSPKVLALWRAAGLPIGNHSWSHPNLAQVGTAAFLADVDRNEQPLAATMGQEDWHWFRYPFLSEGSDPAPVRAALRQRGYRIAGVTMDFADYAYNDALARCAAKGDTATIARLETDMLAAARTQAIRARDLSQALYGRAVPQVLLMHLGGLDARVMPRLLAQYRQLGFRFVSLQEAQADPFFAAATDLSRPGPTPSLEREAQARGLPVPAGATPPAASVCA